MFQLFMISNFVISPRNWSGVIEDG